MTIQEVRAGNTVCLTALCTKREERLKKDGSVYLSLTLTDTTGGIELRVWDVEFADGIDAGCVVGVSNAIAQEYSGQLQLVAKQPLKVESVPPEQFFPKTKYSIEKMYALLRKHVDSVQDAWCRKLLSVFFDDGVFVERFCKSSAAVSVHGACVGGLLEHTVGVVRMSVLAGKVYPWLNKDLLVTAAILHDVGKIYEISAFPENAYEDVGYYVGHLSYGVIVVDRACSGIDGFPDDVRLKVLHCMLAHHGKLEFGSPKLPSLPEAFVISQMDNLDAKLSIFEAESKPGEWSAFNKYLGTCIRRGDFAEGCPSSVMVSETAD